MNIPYGIFGRTQNNEKREQPVLGSRARKDDAGGSSDRANKLNARAKHPNRHADGHSQQARENVPRTDVELLREDRPHDDDRHDGINDFQRQGTYSLARKEIRRLWIGPTFSNK